MLPSELTLFSTLYQAKQGREGSSVHASVSRELTDLCGSER